MNADRDEAADPDVEAAQTELNARQLGPRMVQSDEILKGDDEVQIVHFENVYRLRKTRNGKLILQK